ncbi:CRTAC1 family protein [Mucilaginibacter ginsenosidivorax]|uniref:CRTAC1 family protein n=1 Tax=Mucilaginibacter ginsenosidivorax TaxID=862126 RepID=A0A5B8W1E4_9SPHI|nr:CRTAC1 family protein [Mucilaginibacter ginsenosidivorax]QEC77521.1 CRTAC1 family protein [Mucilaginibacter ginsenosidivorax]
MKIKIAAALTLIVAIGFTIIASSPKSSHQEMIELLQQLNKKNNDMANPFNPEVKIAYCDSLVKIPPNDQDSRLLSVQASLLIMAGQEEKAVSIYENIINRLEFMPSDRLLSDVGIAYMRLGERSNCMLNHTGSSCIFPIKNDGVHKLQTGSRKAIQVYKTILKVHPDDMESRWLLNIAYMTLGEYPQNVPKNVLIPGLNADSVAGQKPFKDIAKSLGLNVNGRAGGVAVDDFNNDGYLDIVTSAWDLSDPMHYFENNKDGTFTDRTEYSGLKGVTGGLNIQQTDYNNDGNIDLFVLRGAWLTKGYGNQPSSLLRNNGDGTFTDVTIPSGLLYFHPTQTATWADFNNDGWLDVFVGTETSTQDMDGNSSTCMLYINNHDGTFTNVTKEAHCDVMSFVKGVTSADYDNDGYPDIFISTMTGSKYLLRNKGIKGGKVDFEDVTQKAGFAQNKERTFTTWFYDYDNDGWQDVLVSDYSFNRPLAYYSAAAALGKAIPDAGNVFLYHNNHNGTFTNVTHQVGLDKVVYSMGGNFGDIDNDGYLDMYFGTGNPDFRSLVPNKMFRNDGGKKFIDITTSSRLGNLQKGHGIAFADLRNTGNQDIFAQMGGAYIGDSYTSSLYLNPRSNNNNWISLKLDGVKANKAAIGSHIKLTFTENGVKRSVYKDVNSGGSFGSSPLRQEIGIGQAKVIDDIEIKWAGSGTVQHFTNVSPNQFLRITEGVDQYKVTQLAKLTFIDKQDMTMCMPMAAKTN